MQYYSKYLNDIITEVNDTAVVKVEAKSFTLQGSSSTITEKSFNNVTHSGISLVTDAVGEFDKCLVRVSELMPGGTGLVNTTLDFDLIDEDQFIPENSYSFTFKDGKVMLPTSSGWSGLFDVQKDEIVPDVSESMSNFGSSIATYGTNDEYMLVGQRNATVSGVSSAGKAYLFHNNGTAWDQLQVFESPTAQDSAYFGHKIVVENGTLFISAPGAKTSGDTTSDGEVYRYQPNGELWELTQTITAYGINAVYLGSDMALYGTELAIGGSNGVYIFHNDIESWNLTQTITRTVDSSEIQFGSSIFHYNNYLFVGRYVYSNNSTSWDYVQTLVATDDVAVNPGNDQFGNAVRMVGDYVVVADRYANSGSFDGAGQVYVFHNNAGSFDEVQTLYASDRAASDSFGTSLDWLGDTLVVGSPMATVAGLTYAGKSYIYRFDGSTFTEVKILTLPPPASFDVFGVKVKLTPTYAVICAGYYKVNGIDNAGAIFTFVEGTSYTSEPVYLTTSDQNQISLTSISKLNSITITDTTPTSTEIRPLVSFDGRNQWKGVVNDSLSDVTGLGFDELTRNYPWAYISGGYYHTIAIKSDGTLWAWGRNNYGQLGDGTTVNKSSPIQIGTDTNWVSISCGQDYTIAIKSDGTLWAWGGNNYGQLGDGTAVDKHSPTQIGTDTSWTSISCGQGHTIAIKSDGTLWAWGLNNYGQLGDGTIVDKHSPIQIGTDTSWASISCGRYHTIAIKSDGTLWAWGWNYDGQLGDGTTGDKHSPIQIGTDTDWVSISCGQGYTIAIKSDGTLWAWGNTGFGQLGDGTTVNKSSPIQIGTDTSWASISCGYFHTIAIKSDGTLWAWGWNYYGQLGDGTTVDKNSPIQIGTDTDWVSISCGRYHTIAIKSDGTLWAWGYNSSGQLGDGTIVNKHSPIQIGDIILTFLVLLQNALANYVISSEQSLDFAFQLATTDSSVTPSVDQVTLNYDEVGYYRQNLLDYTVEFLNKYNVKTIKNSVGSKNIKISIFS